MLYNNGKPMKQAQIKAYIMKVNNWSEAEYNKQRYTLKNKLRTLEAYERSEGKQVTVQSPVAVLYKEARAKHRYGDLYQPSLRSERLHNFNGAPNVKAIDKMLNNTATKEKLGEQYAQTTNEAFSRLIEVDAKAKQIAEAIKNPVKREQALKAYADALHAKQDAAGKTKEGDIPFGEAIGYEAEFDYSEYM